MSYEAVPVRHRLSAAPRMSAPYHCRVGLAPTVSAGIGSMVGQAPPCELRMEQLAPGIRKAENVWRTSVLDATCVPL